MFFRRLPIIILLLIISIKSFALAITNAAQPVYYFSGRNEELRKIKNLFDSGENVVSIVGVSGIGKTEILRKYLSQTKNYSLIWVFDCQIDFRLQFQHLAKAINKKYRNKKQVVSEDIESCIDSVILFSQQHKDWLIAFDNLRIGDNTFLRF